jgi:hypothetical protein
MNFLEKRIHDRNPVNGPAVLQIFGQKGTAATLFGGENYESIPEGETVQPMNVDGREDVPDRRLNDVKPGEELNPLLGQSRFELEFSCGGEKVFLKNLNRYESGPHAEVICDQCDGFGLFGRVSGIVSIDEDFGIEKRARCSSAEPHFRGHLSRSS